LVEAATEALNRLSTDESYADMAAAEVEILPQVKAILAKKEETRPVTPEEYHQLTAFVTRVEQEVMARRVSERLRIQEQLELIRQRVPVGAYQTGLAETGLSNRVLNPLTEAGYLSAGQVLEQMELDPDKILALQGIGPKAIVEIGEKLRSIEYPEPLPLEVLAEQASVEPAAATEPGSEGPPAEPGAEMLLLPASAGETVLPAEGQLVEIGPDGTPVAQPLEKVFEAAEELLQGAVVEPDEDEEREGAEAVLEGTEKPKKAKKRAKIVEYDPDLDTTVVRHKHKSGSELDWENLDEPEKS
jgi:hypothetical protein